MKRELNVVLSGLGFSTLSEARKRLLTKIFLISMGLHVVALLIFGGWVIMTAERDETTVFVTPPPMRRYEPRKLEHRVKVQTRQRSSSRPSMVPKMVSTRPSDLSLPEIRLDSKVIQTTFQPRFKAVTGVGLGAGIGTGYGVGGFGSGINTFNFFGIRARSERVAIILDVSVSMAEESEDLGVTEKGIAQFERVKNRVADVIDAFPPEMLFNLIVYAETASQWRDQMQVANEANKRDAKQYMAPFNSQAAWDSVGHRSGISQIDYGLSNRAAGGTTRFDIALALAFKSQPDTILIICDGDVWTVHAHSPEELQAHEQAVERWRRDNAAALARREASRTTEQVWVEGTAARGAVIRERGGRQASGATEGRWETRTVTTYRGNIPPQPQLPTKVWTLSDYKQHIEKLHEQFLAPQGRPMPTIHVIGFRSGREDSDFLRRLARAYRGQFRRLAHVR